MKGTLIGMDNGINDDSLDCVYNRPKIMEEEETKPKTRYNGSLRDRIISYCVDHPKTTKGDILIHISGSGTCSSIVTGLIRAGILKEHPFDCGSCKYFSVDMSKVFEA